MPYFGATTLARIVDGLSPHPHELPTTGRALLHVLFELDTPFDPATTDTPRPGAINAEMRIPHSSANLERLAELSHVNASLWIVERLADGLAHAHQRGILHSDLKPANILITDEGQPMLLDFNVSVDAKLPPELRAARVGGTLPYMRPNTSAHRAIRGSRLMPAATCTRWA